MPTPVVEGAPATHSGPARRIAHRFTVQSLLLAAVAGATAHAADPTSQPSEGRLPNVIFILADDLGYADLGCYGQQRITTPNIDRMAAEGLRFTDAYAGATVCAPSRCVLMTGLHGGHARVRGNTPATDPGAALQADDVTVASVLKDAGYSTALIGKWGLGEPTKNEQGLPRRHGFDYFFGYLKQGHAHNYYTDFLWRNEQKVKLPNVLSKDPAFINNVAEKKVVYSHDLFADEALQFVEQHKDHPFFLYLAFTIPHANNEAGDHGMETPDYGDYANLDWPEPEKGHAAMISRMDADVGRLLALVKKLRLDEDTLVVFSSDNGPHREGGHDPDFNDSNGPLTGYKGNLTEGGIREPFVVRWPGHVKPGTTSDTPITFADMMPTLASVAGAKAPAGIDGVDVSPTLLGGAQPELADRHLYWEFNREGLREQAARHGKWKAIRNPQSKVIKLYDLNADVGEEHDLATTHPELTAQFDDFFNGARTENAHWPVTVAVGKAR